MSVYPFYIKTEADGRKTPIAGGTRRKDGFMYTDVKQRDRGEITTPYTIKQFSYHSEDGNQKLVTAVYYQGLCISEHVTNY